MSSSLPRSVIVVDKGGVVSVELPEVVPTPPPIPTPSLVLPAPTLAQR